MSDTEVSNDSFRSCFYKKWFLMFKRPVWPQVFSCTELQTMRILNPQVFIVDYLSYSKWTSVFEFIWLLLFMLSSYATMHTQICLIADMLFFFLFFFNMKVKSLIPPPPTLCFFYKQSHLHVWTVPRGDEHAVGPHAAGQQKELEESLQGLPQCCCKMTQTHVLALIVKQGLKTQVLRTFFILWNTLDLLN